MARFEIQFDHGPGEIVVLDDVLQQLRLQIVVRRVRYRDADGLPLFRAVLNLSIPVESFISVFEDPINCACSCGWCTL